MIDWSINCQMLGFDSRDVSDVLLRYLIASPLLRGKWWISSTCIGPRYMHSPYSLHGPILSVFLFNFTFTLYSIRLGILLTLFFNHIILYWISFSLVIRLLLWAVVSNLTSLCPAVQQQLFSLLISQPSCSDCIQPNISSLCVWSMWLSFLCLRPSALTNNLHGSA